MLFGIMYVQLMKDYVKDKDIIKDYHAIAVTMAIAFLVGFLGGSFDAMVVISIPSYIALRYLQTKGLV